eukprot:scaffold10670_cov60-Cyclotella_meneghiniana.AAC.4
MSIVSLQHLVWGISCGSVTSYLSAVLAPTDPYPYLIFHLLSHHPSAQQVHTTMMGDNNRNDDDNNNNTVESQFEDILSLVIARSRGEVGNDAVENALSSIVVVPKTSPNNGAAAEKTSRATTKGLPNRHGVIQDTDNYDFDEDDNDNDDDCGGGTKPTASAQPPNIPQAAAAAAAAHAPSKSSTTTIIPKQRYDESIQDIPLGKMGSRMLITFGDGPQPRPEVVEAALLGARSSLQRAVLDARALYR